MSAKQDESYLDDRQRTRWRRNDEIAEKLKQLGDFLIISGYEESHATRYGQLAYTISRYPISLVELHADGRLSEIPGVGATIANILSELIERGTCAKMEGWAKHTPKSVLELTAIPGLGAKTVRFLYGTFGIDSLRTLREALDDGTLHNVKGLGQKTLLSFRRYLEERGEWQACLPF